MATQIGTVIDGKYEILKQIGKGGMSTVYLAMDKRLNKQWAVKEIKRKGLDKNNEEVINEVPADAEMMKSLDHPAIPTIVDIIDNKENEYIYVVMDYVEGESLDKVLKEYGAQPQNLVIDWAKQICDALGYLHSRKPPIIYRDMKPANIMLKPEGNIKIIDFGIAREYKETNLADTTVLGTRGYASPEHYGSRQTDARSDIYTLGMTMHHLVTGVDPRPADYIYAPIRQWNPELSGGLERIIDKCVSPDPKDRYQNCNELLYALEHYEEEDDAFKKKQKGKLLTFIISVSLAVIFALTGFTTTKLSENAERNNYDKLIRIDKNLDYDNVYSRIKSAIKIDITDSRAYENFLEYIISNDDIDKTELQGFSTIFNDLEANYKDNIYDETFAKISLKTGINYFLYYDLSNNSSPRERAKRAINYFESIKDGNFSVSEMAESLFTICDLYKRTNFGNSDGGYKDDETNTNYSVESIDYEKQYANVFSSLRKCIDYLETKECAELLKTDEGEERTNFAKSAMYKSSLDFINVDKENIASPNCGNVDESIVIDLIDTLKDKTNLIDEPAVEGNGAWENKKYILENIERVRNAVEAQYEDLDS